MISPFDLVVKRLWGPTVRLHSLAKELGREGHRVVLAGPPPFDGLKPPVLDGVSLHYFRRPFYRYCYPDDDKAAERKKINRRIRVPLVLWSRFLEIMGLIRKHRIDILYVNRAYLDTAYPSFAAHLLNRVPIIYDWDDIEGLHGFATSFGQPLWLQLLDTFNEVLFPRLADATVVASRYLQEFALRIGVRENRLLYAPTVADSDIFRPDIEGAEIREKYGLQKKKVLLYCGNLMEGSGVKVENVIHTLKILLQKDRDFSLIVIGDGDLLSQNGKKGHLTELVDVLGISESVIFTGGIPYALVPKYVASADLCLALFPVSLITMAKSPLKVYEYMAAGKPVIARDVGELSLCIIDGETGLLVYSDKPAEYAAKIMDIFSGEGVLERMGRNARILIEKQFNWKNSADMVIKACKVAMFRYRKARS